MVVEGAVGGSDEILGDSAAEEDVGYPVWNIVNSGFIPS